MIANGHTEERVDRALKESGAASGAWSVSDAVHLPARDAEGRIIRWNILLMDIEDRKQAEEKMCRIENDLKEAQHLSCELQHERDRYLLLLDLSNRVASDLDLHQVFQAISSEIRHMFKCDFVGLARLDNTPARIDRTTLRLWLCHTYL